jgi:3D (Asp-Asp-Asp) domain-containing protein
MARPSPDVAWVLLAAGLLLAAATSFAGLPNQPRLEYADALSPAGLPSTQQFPPPEADIDEVSNSVAPSVAPTDCEISAGPTFDRRPLRHIRTVRMRVTAYSPDARSCGQWADGFTASGYSVWTNGMKLVAADTSLLPFGSLVSIDGYDRGRVVPVLDRGGAIKGDRLDVLMPTHEQALQWGVRWIDVDVWDYADQ